MKISLCWLVLPLVLFGNSLCAQFKTATPGAPVAWEFASFGAGADGKLVSAKNTITINTQRTRHCFYDSDSYSFAWRKQAFPYDDCSRSEVSVHIAKFTMGNAGVMMRSSKSLGAANVHLEAGVTGDVLLFWRKAESEMTSYTHVTSLPFPMDLKLVRQGTVFTAYYKNDKGEWVKGSSAVADVGPEQLEGFYACSGSNSQIGYSDEANESADASFSNWTFNYTENFIPPEKDFKDNEPIKPNTLLRDNFDDGSLSNTPASIINPVWAGIKYGNLPYDKNGGRYWRKVGDGTFYLGSKKWADYQTSVDVAFDANSKPNSEFMLQMRYQNISIYGAPKFYALVLRGGNQLFFERYDSGVLVFSRQVAVPGYFDGSKHKIALKMLDRNYEVYYDGKKMLDGVDADNPITYGSICLKFTDVAMDVDNLEVIKIDDPINGVTDNYLQDYYDTPLPAYLKNYGYK